MFVEFKQQQGRRCSVAIAHILGFYEATDNGDGGCTVLLNCSSGNIGTNETGTTAGQLGVFSVYCAESYDDLKRTIQQQVTNALRQALAPAVAETLPPPPSRRRP